MFEIKLHLADHAKARATSEVTAVAAFTDRDGDGVGLALSFACFARSVDEQQLAMGKLCMRALLARQSN